MTASTAKPAGEPRAKPVVTDGGPWRGISEAEWIERVSRPATPEREYEVIDGVRHFRSWINPDRERAS